MDTRLHGCKAARLLLGNSINHEWSLDPPHSVHTLLFMHPYTYSFFLKVNQMQGHGETQCSCISKISQHVKPTASWHRPLFHPRAACSALPSVCGALSRCSDFHLLIGCSWHWTWFAPSKMPDSWCMVQQQSLHTHTGGMLIALMSPVPARSEGPM